MKESPLASLQTPSQVRAYVLAHGIPEDDSSRGSVRAGLWRRFLSQVPLEQSSNTVGEAREGEGEVVRGKSERSGRDEYYALVEGVLGRINLGDSDVVEGEELNLSPSDQCLIAIDKDVQRTHLSLSFFTQHTPAHALSPLSPPSIASVRTVANRRALFDRLERIFPQVDEEDARRRRRRRQRTIKATGRSGLRREDTVRALASQTDTSVRASKPEESYRYSIATDITVPSSIQSFDTQTTSDTPLSSDMGQIREEPESEAEAEKVDLHWEAIERILYIYAVLNPGIGYVQGMNELLAPIYFVLAHDTKEENLAHSEADAFWCFNGLMAEVRDLFTKSLDGDVDGNQSAWTEARGRGARGRPTKEKTGIGFTLRKFTLQLKWLDVAVWEALREKGVKPSFYAFRWLTTMLSQEFPLPEVIRIWDVLFALIPRLGEETISGGSLSPTLEFLVDFCCAMTIREKERILTSSFTVCMGILQRPSIDDVDGLIRSALVIRERKLAASMLGVSPPENSDDEMESADEVVPQASSGWGSKFGLGNLGMAKKRFAEATNQASNYVSRMRRPQSVDFRFANFSSDDFSDTRSEISDLSIATAPPATGSMQRSRSPIMMDKPLPPIEEQQGAVDYWKKYANDRLRAMQDSDTAAQLSKSVSNLTVTATLWRDQAPSAMETAMEKVKHDAAIAAERLKKETTLAATKMHVAAPSVFPRPNRPDSPDQDPPFQPPNTSFAGALTFSASDTTTTSLADPTTPLNVQSFPRSPTREGTGPRPLFLATSIRRDPSVSPPASRRVSKRLSRSPLLSPRVVSGDHAPRSPIMSSSLHYRSESSASSTGSDIIRPADPRSFQQYQHHSRAESDGGKLAQPKLSLAIPSQHTRSSSEQVYSAIPLVETPFDTPTSANTRYASGGASGGVSLSDLIQAEEKEEDTLTPKLGVSEQPLSAGVDTRRGRGWVLSDAPSPVSAIEPRQSKYSNLGLGRARLRAQTQGGDSSDGGEDIRRSRLSNLRRSASPSVLNLDGDESQKVGENETEGDGVRRKEVRRSLTAGVTRTARGSSQSGTPDVSKQLTIDTLGPTGSYGHSPSASLSAPEDQASPLSSPLRPKRKVATKRRTLASSANSPLVGSSSFHIQTEHPPLPTVTMEEPSPVVASFADRESERPPRESEALKGSGEKEKLTLAVLKERKKALRKVVPTVTVAKALSTVSGKDLR